MLEDYPDVITPNQLRQILHIGRDKTYSLLNRGVIQAVLVGKNYRIPKSSVLHFLSSPNYTGGVDVGLNTNGQ